VIKTFWNYRELILRLTYRDVVGRYRGSMLGLMWSFLTPLLMLFIFTFFFSIIFNARWGGVEESRASFAVLLFAGLIVHGLFAEVLTRAPNAIQANPNFVKKIVFPLEVLPVVTLLSAVIHGMISLAILIAAILFSQQHIPVTAFWLPVVLTPFFLLSAGVAWALAAAGVYLRDISQVTGLLVTALLFLSPIFFPLSTLPEWLRFWVLLNPLTLIVEQLRAVLIMGVSPDAAGLLIYFICSGVAAFLGYRFFQSTRKGFANVL